eukprot:INCI9330.1.p1 GENE.INCI9330.1~~INCI9330.1.p1  ORF type:complete len:840 (+),score=180.15 INCI9330.1:120-2522(+)
MAEVVTAEQTTTVVGAEEPEQQEVEQKEEQEQEEVEGEGEGNSEDEEEEEDDDASEDVPEDLDYYLSDGEEEHEEDVVYPDEVPDDTNCLMIIDGLPVIPHSKAAKLTELLMSKVLPVKKRVGDKTEKIAPVNFTMPFNEEKDRSLGFGIVEYASSKQTKVQIERLSGFSKFGMNLKAWAYGQVRMLCAVPDHLEDRKVEDHPEYKFLRAQTKRPLHQWLTDKRVRDQFVIRFALDTQVHWADTVAGGELDYGGEREQERNLNWCEMHVCWSPRGTYLLTQHHKGVALWGGPNWEKVLRVPCENVRRVQFSPQEEFLFTWNGGGSIIDEYGTRAPNGRKAVTLWNVKKGAHTKLKHFDYEPFSSDHVSDEWDNDEWKYFKWSSDDRYFARAAFADVEGDASDKAPEERDANILRVYDTATLKSTSVIAKGIRNCEWSPGTGGKKGSNNIIAYWEPEEKKKSRHASVTLRQWPSKKLLRQQTLYNVNDCTIYWQNNGDFMCAHVERHSASKKTYFTNLELFRIRDRDIPVETLEIRETVHGFAWEPNGVRFCVIHGSSTNTVSIYTMHAVRGGDAYALTWQLDQKKCTGIYWSPIGRHAVLAGKGQGNYHGALEFIDADDQVVLNAAEHFMCKHVTWDAGGRMVATAATLPMPRPGQASQSADLERGYRIWTFQGDIIKKHDVHDFYQFRWRPRPSSLLADKEREEVVKNMSQKARKFKEQDRLLQESDALAKAKEKSLLRKEFHDTLASLHEWYLSEQPMRIEIQGYDDTALPCKEEIFDMEQVIDERREPYKPDDELDE